MQIVFTGAETTFTKTAKGGYSTMVVSYLDEGGRNKTWKLISFSNPKVFDTFKNAKPNDVYNITTRKNDKDFTEWSSAEIVTGATPTAGGAAPKTPVVSQYETRDERNLRQRLIVRQSCLAQAIAFYGDELGQDEDAMKQVLGTADQFVAWVFEAPGLFPEEAE